jgi:hypothetical protein
LGHYGEDSNQLDFYSCLILDGAKEEIAYLKLEIEK